jgi:hypothetical protein
MLDAHVYAGRRLVQEQHLGLAGQPPSQDDFLLVAAGKVAHRKVFQRGPDIIAFY